MAKKRRGNIFSDLTNNLQDAENADDFHDYMLFSVIAFFVAQLLRNGKRGILK